MEDYQKQKLMILAENVLICQRRVRRMREAYREVQAENTRFINEFMPQVKQLMGFYVQDEGKKKFTSSRVTVIAKKDGSVYIK